ncbi:hypothetical protein CRE_29463 [Caenorhabditis remanei]|uniref:Uncharacterized protein n=1 Tax=Caenorhabditis remanei TaxID=31234 RepID=E3LV50_CAERE|nr:hypothetical protein CRE_29463 [Caenorhabditis remanei]
MRLQVFVLSFFLSFGFSEKLSPEEDQERAKTCGRISNQNAETNDELSPWTVRIQIKDKHFNPATLVSKRHILSSGSIVINKVKNKEKWKWSMNGEEIDMANCNDNKMEVPTELLTAHYIGPCDAKSSPEGLIIVEMERDIPGDSEYFTPACIPDISIAIDEQLTSHKAHIDSNQNIVIEMLPTKVVACATPSDHLFCGELSKCPTGSTIPLVKRVDGADTVVGFSIHYNGDCKLFTFASVMYYKEHLCDLIGICEKTSPGQYTPKQIPPPTEISLSNKFNKLTSSELSEYTKSCGKPTISGSSLPIDLSPWSVTVITQESTGMIYYPATLISKRHVVVVSFAFLKENPVKFFDGTDVDRSKCQFNVMEIPTEIIKKTSVDLSTCNDASKCGSQVSKQVKSAVYFGVCEPEVHAFGVILLEMESDIPAELPYLVPSCIPGKATPVFEDNLHVHSIGLDTNGQYTRQINEAKTEKCTYGYLFYCKVCATRIECNKDSSGGLSRNMNGQETLIGILYYYDPKCVNDQFVSMEMLSDLFCVYAGICAEKSSVPAAVPSITATSGYVPVKTTPSKPDPSTEKAVDQDTLTTMPSDSSAEDATTQKDDKVVDLSDVSTVREQKLEDEITPEAVQPTDKPKELETTEPAELDEGENTVEDNTPTENGKVPVKTTPSKPDPSAEKDVDQDTVTTIPAESLGGDVTTQKDDKVIDQKPEDEITPEVVQPTDKPEEPVTTEPVESDGDETTLEDNPPTEKPDEPAATEPTEPEDDDDNDEDPEEIPKEKPKDVQKPEKQVQNPRKVPRVDDEEEEEDDEEEEENEHKTTTAIPSSGAMIRSSGIVVSLICVIFDF